jgi:hypothetical protein
MRWINFSRLNPWRWKRNKRLEQYIETEKHEWMDAIERHRTERDGKERQIDLELFHEGRKGQNWLENREMRMSAMVLEYQRTLIAARIDIRKRLGMECPQLLSDAELAKLNETMLRSLQVARGARQQDYRRRAHAAGLSVSCPEQRDAPAYGDLEALVRREIRKLSLAHSLGRTGKPTGKFVSRARMIWTDPVWSKVIAVALVALFTWICAYLGRKLWSAHP